MPDVDILNTAGDPLLPTKFLGDFPTFPRCRVWKHGTLGIICSEDHGIKGQVWRHVSISHQHRYPTWDEIVDIRDRLFSESAVVVQFLPPKEIYVNDHENCFHLWERLDEPLKLPDAGSV